MEDFGTIDEEFTESCTETPVEYKQQDYKALQCEPCWFLSESQDELWNIKLKADYWYMKKKYQDAVKYYKKYITDAPNTSSVMKRDCLEGIARSYLSLNCFCHGLIYATEVNNLSSNFDSNSVSLNLLLDFSLKAGRYKEAILHGQKLVSLHASNCDVWLKLGISYAGLYHLPIPYELQFDLKPNSDFRCCATTYSLKCTCGETWDKDTNSYLDVKRGSILVVTCLLHCDFLLKSVVNSSFGFAQQLNIDLQEKILKEIDHFCVDSKYLEMIQLKIKDRYAGIKCDQNSLNDDFIDRASSKFTQKELVNYILEVINGHEFEKQWLFNSVD